MRERGVCASDVCFCFFALLSFPLSFFCVSAHVSWLFLVLPLALSSLSLFLRRQECLAFHLFSMFLFAGRFLHPFPQQCLAF